MKQGIRAALCVSMVLACVLSVTGCGQSSEEFGRAADHVRKAINAMALSDAQTRDAVASDMKTAVETQAALKLVADAKKNDSLAASEAASARADIAAAADSLDREDWQQIAGELDAALAHHRTGTAAEATYVAIGALVAQEAQRLEKVYAEWLNATEYWSTDPNAKPEWPIKASLAAQAEFGAMANQLMEASKLDPSLRTEQDAAQYRKLAASIGVMVQGFRAYKSGDLKLANELQNKSNRMRDETKTMPTSGIFDPNFVHRFDKIQNDEQEHLTKVVEFLDEQ